MVTIVLCDDEVESLQRTEAEIERIKEKLPYPVDVVKYADTDYLMERIDNRELQSDISVSYTHLSQEMLLDLSSGKR